MLPDTVTVPDFVLDIARRLDAHGHEVWCVGGALRDAALGHARADVDLATSARPEEVRRLFRRTVPIGIDHGTVAVLDPDNKAHEVTTFRQDVTTDGRHAVVKFGVSLEEDLARRDFTINAIAFHPLTHEWRDPHGGADDLERRVVRAVGDPVRRFTEDHLRILRAIRFAAQFDFEIESATWDAARRLVESTRHLSAERVRDEWWKGLTTARTPRDFVDRWAAVGVLGIWLPELHPESSDWDEKLDAADRLPGRDPFLVTLLLSSDPPATLRRFKCANALIRRATEASALRDAYPHDLGRVTVRRWLSEASDAASDLLALAVARGYDRGLQEAVDREREAAVPLSIGDLEISGNTVMSLGVLSGPRVGHILDVLLDEVLEHPEHNRADWLRRRVGELAAANGG